MRAKSTLSSPQNPSRRHFPNIRKNIILHLCCSKFVQKVVPSLHKPTTRYMFTLPWVNGSVCAKSGQSGHVHPRSSVHEILVIKSRWSLTTEIVKSSFNCTCNRLAFSPFHWKQLITMNLLFYCIYESQAHVKQLYICGCEPVLHTHAVTHLMCNCTYDVTTLIININCTMNNH